MSIERALKIPGWMTPEELTWLAEQAASHQKIVEIGSYLGRSTRALGDNTKGCVIAVDDFYGPRDINLPMSVVGHLFEAFVHNVRDLIVSGKIVPVIADHSLIQVEDRPDMVFIDGSHEYPDVRRDIKKWLACIAPGGLLCGHDFTNIIGVKQAVQEFVKDYKIVPDTSIWYTTIAKDNQ